MVWLSGTGCQLQDMLKLIMANSLPLAKINHTHLKSVILHTPLFCKPAALHIPTHFVLYQWSTYLALFARYQQ